MVARGGRPGGVGADGSVRAGVTVADRVCRSDATGAGPGRRVGVAGCRARRRRHPARHRRTGPRRLPARGSGHHRVHGLPSDALCSPPIAVHDDPGADQCQRGARDRGLVSRTGRPRDGGGPAGAEWHHGRLRCCRGTLIGHGGGAGADPLRGRGAHRAASPARARARRRRGSARCIRGLEPARGVRPRVRPDPGPRGAERVHRGRGASSCSTLATRAWRHCQRRSEPGAWWARWACRCSSAVDTSAPGSPSPWRSGAYPSC